MKVLFLNPPSFDGFDGGAGSRYQARREIRSFWYPTWLAQPAAMIPGSKLIDAPAAGYELPKLLDMAQGFDLTVVHTSTPSLRNDIKTAEALKNRYGKMTIGFVGPHTSVLPEETLKSSPLIDFVTRDEFDYTIKEIAAGKPLAEVEGISLWQSGKIVHNPPRPLIHNMDDLPYVVDVYKRDLRPEDYAIGYLLYPYLSLYSGRGCPSHCTFCLWPQTIGGHQYRTRSPQNVVAEIKLAHAYFPQVKEFFFDDDTFTADIPRALVIAEGLGKLGVTWSCNAKANLNYDTLQKLKENGLRLLLVGYESGNQQILNNIKKGIKLDKAREFTSDCKKLGITVHGTFILGLPEETPETIEETIRFACEIDPDTIQVALAAPYPGTELYKQAQEKGWFARQQDDLVSNDGVQSCVLQYPGMPAERIYQELERFYRRFYFRPKPIWRMLKTMIRDPQERKRRLQDGKDFLKFLTKHKGAVKK
jgi:hopanoid biosynthesis associated radical SAM protein HpnJ